MCTLYYSVHSTVAYALIGSPGRNRWPSPDRHATSYINTDSSESPTAETPPDSIYSDSDSLETIRKLTPPNELAQPPHASREFNSILHGFQFNRKTNVLQDIADPEEYFQKAASWKTT